MSLRVLFFLGFVMVSSGMYFSVKYGLEPKATPLIKATEVSSLEEAGVLVYRRMRQEIRANRVIVAGSSPLVPGYHRFWQGFVLGANNDGARIEKVVASKNVQLFPESEVAATNLVSDISIHIEELTNDAPGKRTMLYTSMLESTHLIDDSLSRQLEAGRVPATLITLTRFLATRDQVSLRQLDCSGAGDAMKSNGTKVIRDMDCLADKISRQHFKKELDATKSYIALYRYGLQDYIAFYYDSQQAVR